MFTGGGKTSCFASLVRLGVENGRKILILVDGDELVDQVRERLFEQVGISPALEKATKRAESWSPCVIGSVKSMTKESRRSRWGRDAFNLIICDEAHHAVAESWKTILDYFVTAKVVGFTATATRRDKRELSEVFEHTCFRMDVLDGILEGWVVPPRPVPIRVDGLDISKIRTIAGELEKESLDAVVRNVDVLQKMAEPTFECVGSRQAIVFCCSVAHAHAFAALLRQLGATADAVDATTPKAVRKPIIEKFRSGELQYLCNYSIVNEGFDVPNAQAIVMATLTKSRQTYIQRVGRGLRPEPQIAKLPTADERIAAIKASSKPEALVLDFLGNSGRHKLVTLARAIFPKISDEVLAKVESPEVAAKQLPLIEAVDMASWMVDEASSRERKGVTYHTMEADIYGNDAAGVMMFLGIKRRGNNKLFSTPLSEAKLAALHRLKIPNASQYNDEEASEILREVYRRKKKNLCTVPQGLLLRKLGYTEDEIRPLKIGAASAILDDRLIGS
jgi:superfamily II DNA or RNA helicase